MSSMKPITASKAVSAADELTGETQKKTEWNVYLWMIYKNVLGLWSHILGDMCEGIICYRWNKQFWEAF